jgi:hypothetical protein
MGATGERTIHHDVHARKLRPDLSEHADMSAVNHVRLEQLEICDVGVISLKLTHFLDLLQFQLDERIIRITSAMNQGKDSMAVLPAILSCEPAWRFWQQEQHEEEEDGW